MNDINLAYRQWLVREAVFDRSQDRRFDRYLHRRSRARCWVPAQARYWERKHRLERRFWQMVKEA